MISSCPLRNLCQRSMKLIWRRNWNRLWSHLSLLDLSAKEMPKLRIMECTGTRHRTSSDGWIPWRKWIQSHLGRSRLMRSWRIWKQKTRRSTTYWWEGRKTKMKTSRRRSRSWRTIWDTEQKWSSLTKRLLSENSPSWEESQWLLPEDQLWSRLRSRQLPTFRRQSHSLMRSMNPRIPQVKMLSQLVRLRVLSESASKCF